MKPHLVTHRTHRPIRVPAGDNPLEQFKLASAAVQSHILDMEAMLGRDAALREVESIYASYRGQVNALNKGEK